MYVASVSNHPFTSRKAEIHTGEIAQSSTAKLLAKRNKNQDASFKLLFYFTSLSLSLSLSLSMSLFHHEATFFVSSLIFFILFLSLSLPQSVLQIKKYALSYAMLVRNHSQD